MLYYAYKLVRGTAAIIVFRGFVIIYIIWWITDLLNMNILSSILGGFIGVGVFAVIIVFQQEIRKFLLLLGSSRITNNKSLWRRFNLFFKISKEQTKLNIEDFLVACDKLKKDKTEQFSFLKEIIILILSRRMVIQLMLNYHYQL